MQEMMEEIVELTKTLIRFKTVQSRPDEIQRCAAFLEGWLKEHGLSYERLDREGVPSLWVAPPDRKVPVLLMSHLDVVDAPDELFEPVVREGKLYGRGSIDDKYAVALSLVLMHRHVLRLKKRGCNLAHASVGILVTGDEEVGGHHGAKAALEKIKADFCIALDGGNVGEIVVKEKGILTLKLSAKGKAAHGSRPWLGVNAIEALIDDYSNLKSFFPPPTGDCWHRTLSFNVVSAGKAFNQVPEAAEGVFDIRYTEKDDVETLVNQMQKAVTGDLEVMEREPLFFSGSSSYIELLQESAPGSRLAFEHGASDARFLVEFGIPGVVWGADGEHSAHSSQEHVFLSSIPALLERLETFIERIHSERDATGDNPEE